MTEFWTDDAGTGHGPAAEGFRILSLVPSLTELLFDLGLGDHIVGRTAFCTEPRDRVRAVKTVGGTKTVKMAKVDAVKPTHAVVNIDETPKAVAEELSARGIEVIVTHPVRVADNARVIGLLGGVFGAGAEAARLNRAFEDAHRRLLAGAGARPERHVLYLIWKDPWMTISAETYIADMLALAGWRAAAVGGADVRYPEFEMTGAVLDDIDLVLFSSEPFAFTDKHVAEFRRAFPAHARKARLVDGQMLSWYGSRAIAGLDYLSQLAAGEAP